MTDVTSQTALTSSLSRLDPTLGLVEYIQEVKPYHSKVLDVLVEYVYVEDVNVTITDTISWVMEFTRPDVDVVYSCGYGFVWDPVLTPDTPDTPLAPMLILEATDAIEVPGTDYENSNSFLIQSATYVPFETAAANIVSNQFVLSKNYTMNGVNVGTNEWLVNDPSNTLVTELTTAPTPKTFFVSSDTETSANTSFTVSGVPTHVAGVTRVTALESISAAAIGDGVFHRVLEGNELPQWPAGQAVTFNTVSGTLPTPIVNGTRYYFQPTTEPGYFNIATVRNPFEYGDYLDIGTQGSGTFTIERDESLIPGAAVVVSGTHYSRNNGQYIVKNIVPEGSDERVFVYQKVDSATPAGFLGADGIMTLVNVGLVPPEFCPPVKMPDLHTDLFIHESLKFTFELNPADAITATYGENQARGYGETLFGNAIEGSYGTYADSFFSRTAPTSGSPGPDSAHTILPTGIDTQLYDVGGIDQTLQTVKQFYGRNVP